MNPAEIGNHSTKSLTIIINVNAIEISIPRYAINPAKLPSTTPIPTGKNDTNPNMIELEYMVQIANNSKILIPNATRIK